MSDQKITSRAGAAIFDRRVTKTYSTIQMIHAKGWFQRRTVAEAEIVIAISPLRRPNARKAK
ncbi:hypothetical protein [Parvibaculum sedimenti]|uniref:hypothetical protein n=1 Tax=Parvibaculum sedimenti TaxID=2608632 RepID=UPI00163AFA27|nr:hypothetical protein [Parvibaculum sedimenti]